MRSTWRASLEERESKTPMVRQPIFQNAGRKEDGEPRKIGWKESLGSVKKKRKAADFDTALHSKKKGKSNPPKTSAGITKNLMKVGKIEKTFARIKRKRSKDGEHQGATDILMN